MMHLNLRQAQRLRDALAPLYHDTPPPARLLGHLADAVTELLGGEMACFDIFSPAGQMHNLGSSAQSLFEPAAIRQLAARIQEHPLFRSIFLERQDAPLRISDFCSPAKWQQLAIFNDFYRPIRITHQLIVGFEVPGLGFTTCALSRSRRDFSDGERTLLAFAQPHLALLLERASRPADAHGLTAREAQVLDCLRQGQPDKLIAHHCGISPRTVQVHLRNIYAKLGVDNRTAAALTFNR